MTSAGGLTHDHGCTVPALILCNWCVQTGTYVCSLMFVWLLCCFSSCESSVYSPSCSPPCWCWRGWGPERSDTAAPFQSSTTTDRAGSHGNTETATHTCRGTTQDTSWSDYTVWVFSRNLKHEKEFPFMHNLLPQVLNKKWCGFFPANIET